MADENTDVILGETKAVAEQTAQAVKELETDLAEQIEKIETAQDIQKDNDTIHHQWVDDRFNMVSDRINDQASIIDELRAQVAELTDKFNQLLAVEKNEHSENGESNLDVVVIEGDDDIDADELPAPVEQKAKRFFI